MIAGGINRLARYVIGVKEKVTSSLQNKSHAEGSESMKEISLHTIFQCFENEFCDRFASASAEFLSSEFLFSLTGLSYAPNFLWMDNDYFVTQINLGREISLMLKVSDTAANLIFMNSLGKRQEESGFLRLKDITEFEARVLTSYNEFLYKYISELFLTPREINSVINTLNTEKTLYLTFHIYTRDEQEAGRIILSFPEFVFRKMNPVQEPENLLRLDFFNNSYIETPIRVGKTSAPLNDIKNLETEDLIILDNSNLHTMYLSDFDDMTININPDSSLVVNFDDEEDGDDTVIKEKTKNIWDSLEVEVNAGFEKIKMKLGDLREITEGLVIDVASVADNKVYIDVEGQKLAAGELVIVGDKYGVRITEIFNEAKSAEVEKIEEKSSELSVQRRRETEEEEQPEENDDEEIEIDEDFEESDFDIEDEDEE